MLLQEHEWTKYIDSVSENGSPSIHRYDFKVIISCKHVEADFKVLRIARNKPLQEIDWIPSSKAFRILSFFK